MFFFLRLPRFDTFEVLRRKCIGPLFLNYNKDSHRKRIATLLMRHSRFHKFLRSHWLRSYTTIGFLHDNETTIFIVINPMLTKWADPIFRNTFFEEVFLLLTIKIFFFLFHINHSFTTTTLSWAKLNIYKQNCKSRRNNIFSHFTYKITESISKNIIILDNTI